MSVNIHFTVLLTWRRWEFTLVEMIRRGFVRIGLAKDEKVMGVWCNSKVEMTWELQMQEGAPMRGSSQVSNRLILKPILSPGTRTTPSESLCSTSTTQTTFFRKAESISRWCPFTQALRVIRKLVIVMIDRHERAPHFPLPSSRSPVLSLRINSGI